MVFWDLRELRELEGIYVCDCRGEGDRVGVSSRDCGSR